MFPLATHPKPHARIHRQQIKSPIFSHLTYNMVGAAPRCQLLQSIYSLRSKENLLTKNKARVGKVDIYATHVHDQLSSHQLRAQKASFHYKTKLHLKILPNFDANKILIKKITLQYLPTLNDSIKPNYIEYSNKHVILQAIQQLLTCIYHLLTRFNYTITTLSYFFALIRTHILTLTPLIGHSTYSSTQSFLSSTACQHLFALVVLLQFKA